MVSAARFAETATPEELIALEAMGYLGNDEEVVSNAEESLREHKGWVSSELLLIAASQRLGDIEKAQAAVLRMRQSRGDVNKKQLFDVFPMRRDTDFETIAQLLSEAGLLNL